ncbi:MAG TPA: gas vesicle protein GvpJ [Gemmatimonadaceae bacterium]|nr:gas vesicle protein GvpJ [Gemmatimonadaceae bacterium]
MSLDDLLGESQLDLSEVLSHVLDKGVVLKGEVMLAVADIDLIRLDLGLLLTAVETALRRPRVAGARALGLAAPRPGPAEVGTTSGSTMESQVVESLDRAEGAPVTPLETVAEALPPRLNTDPEFAENGLAKLVLTLIEVLRKVLEHQAVRRMEGGHLSDAEIEKLGVALLRLNDRMQEMKGIFGLTDDDLQIDLGPLGKLR